MTTHSRVLPDVQASAPTLHVSLSRAGVTGGLVQYYFPTLDDLFLALLERRSDRNV